MNIAILCFGISSIANVSGTEKVFVDMANHFVKNNNIVYSIWNDKPGIKPYYDFDPRVRQINLDLGKIKVPIYYKIYRELAKGLHINAVNYVDQYKTKQLSNALLKKVDVDSLDLIICYEFNSIMVANLVSQKKIPIIAMCHNSIENQVEALTPLQRKEVSKVDVFQVLMPSFIPKAKKLLNTEICSIPNVIPQVSLENMENLAQSKETYRIVFLGRINKEQKRPLIAVKTFLNIAARFPKWHLDIYGPIVEKEYMQEIDDYIKKYDKGQQVKYKGIVKNAAEALKNADIFVFPSAYEGFGLALGEANAMGIPAVGFSYAPAVGDLIENGKTGFLADTEEDFQNKLEELMVNQSLRCQMGKNAWLSMRSYSPEKVWGQWDQLVEQVIQKKGKLNENI